MNSQNYDDKAIYSLIDAIMRRAEVDLVWGLKNYYNADYTVQKKARKFIKEIADFLESGALCTPDEGRIIFDKCIEVYKNEKK